MKTLLTNLRPRFNREWYKNENTYNTFIFTFFLFRPQGIWAFYPATWIRSLLVILLLISLYLGFFTKIGQKQTLLSLVLSVLFFVVLLLIFYWN
ncbi:TPA: hypothetical protein ACGO4F_000735 [Streptococcus suis]